MEVSIFDYTKSFAEDKDIAKKIRIEEIIPSIKAQNNITLNFKGVDSATQSFVHSLISDVIRQFGESSLELLTFKDCNTTIQKIIIIVVEYMQES